jgi:hypothetical protein
MQNTIVHYEGAASLEAAATKVKPSGAQIKIGLDVHARLYVAVAQYDHLLPKAALRLSPGEFVPWVQVLLGRATACMWFMKRAALGSVSTGN